MLLKRKMLLLGLLATAFSVLFLFWDIGTAFGYVFPRRLVKVAAIILTGSCIAFSTVIFQTITNNRILTPSLIGLDSLYMLIQTAIVFVFGGRQLAMMENRFHFVLSVGLMVLFALLLFRLVFRMEQRNIYFLLLIGIICGTFFSSISSFMQMLIDPNEFSIVQDSMFASFNNVNDDLLGISAIIMILTGVYAFPMLKYLNVMALGQDQAVNLGIPYNKIVRRWLIIIAVLVSVSTALVGPITFLGLLVANVAHQLFQTYRHSYLIIGAVLISIITLAGGQFIVEHLFTFSIPISVIVNFVGGVYFLYLLLKENRSW
ncbi:iron chelate uptake ABC transporter family permease subunit [Halobacillus kuroshimensis]|uniref:Iron chelate uptake ABC transporter family permease subunit n=1 Tax=Halobacillus kuroshimensis TaxID=302481 RepID=A0ABS3DWG5_9BACI|nr:MULTISPECIES: iron chelate uptake ABC transporter family permease subunit [Halobacillus]MBN8235671.1 iron chelate uptake ABC transporter family permease subunit [Halobacillus kuroshimensis]